MRADKNILYAELDITYACSYGLARDETRYILDPKEVYGEDFTGETFRMLKEKEMKKYGEYRTQRLVLEAWDRLEGVEAATIWKVIKIQLSAAMEQPVSVKETYAPPANEEALRVVKEKATQAAPEEPLRCKHRFPFLNHINAVHAG
jgi:hypothetical protein